MAFIAPSLLVPRRLTTPAVERTRALTGPRTGNSSPRRTSSPSACAKLTSAQLSRDELWRSIAALHHSLARAVREEHYTKAASLRDQIDVLASSDDYVRVQRLLDTAVAEQRFLDAANLRDQLATLIPPPAPLIGLQRQHPSVPDTFDSDAAPSPPGTERTRRNIASSRSPSPPSSSTQPLTTISSFPSSASPLLSSVHSGHVGEARGVENSENSGRSALSDMELPVNCPTQSECDSHGIHVSVHSFHMPEHDTESPKDATIRYTFGYRVRIVNTSSSTVQLIARHWIIKNNSDHESEVRGTGVVGRQPVLEPGEAFEYTSACPLTCKLGPGCRVIGSMRGAYTLVSGDNGTEQLIANVDRFYFVLPEI